VNLSALPGAVCIGVALALITYNLRPWRRLDDRTAKYLVAMRNRQGEHTELLSIVATDTDSSVVARVLGPIGRSMADRVLSIIGHQSEDDVRLSLERAGLRQTNPQTYLYQQFAFGLGGLVAGAVVGSLYGTRLAVLMAVAGMVAGASVKRNELVRLTERRRETIRAELLTVNAVLAARARVTPNIQSVVRSVVERGQGEVVGELSRVLSAIQSGTSAEAAFSAAAALTPEPAAGRLYNTLADKLRTGGDIGDALIRQASDIREAERDGRRATATRRKMKMIVATVVFMAPAMFLFIAAPIPSLVLHN